MYIYNECEKIIFKKHNMSQDETNALITDYQVNGNIESRNKVVEDNLGLVGSIVGSIYFKNTFFENSDLFQEGVIGMMTAINKFDTSKGIAFSTYATEWIRQAVYRYIYNFRNQIRLPVHVCEKLREICEKPAFELTDKEFDFLKNIPVTISADTTLKYINDEDDGNSIISFIADTEATPEEYAMSEGLKEYISKVIDTLNPREQIVVRGRFGIDCDAMTLEQIGSQFDPPISRERVRQIERRALIKLKPKLKKIYNSL